MFKVLNNSQKFQTGSFLWLIFFESKRVLFKKINWKTGFLLQKPNDKSLTISKPILLSTQNIFPNNSVLCIPFKKESWTSDIYHFWKQMNKPSLRVFIPSDCEGSQLNQFWPSFERFHNLSYYEEKR